MLLHNSAKVQCLFSAPLCFRRKLSRASSRQRIQHESSTTGAERQLDVAAAPWFPSRLEPRAEMKNRQTLTRTASRRPLDRLRGTESRQEKGGTATHRRKKKREREFFYKQEEVSKKHVLSALSFPRDFSLRRKGNGMTGKEVLHCAV